MLQSEKDLEDYICNNQKEFIKVLKGIYGEDEDIKFVGRQVKIGDGNIADLVYYFIHDYPDAPFNEINFVIVELKFRKLEPKDLAQLSRYMHSLSEKLISDEKYGGYETIMNGVFVSFGEDELMQEITMNLDFENENIHFLEIKNNITFSKESWSYRDEYIDRIKLDSRLEQIYGIND